MGSEIKMEFHSPTSFLHIKEEVWEVCKMLYTIDETAYYDRLSAFKDFAVFRLDGKVIGFLSFFVDEVEIDSKALVLVGIGHGGILPAFRNKSLVPKATVKYLGKQLLKQPFKMHVVWGMAMTHLSYRMGLRGTKFQYPTPEGICPPFYGKIFDWIGAHYYKDTYCNVNYTAEVRFAATGSSVIPTDTEKEDPVVASFLKRVPTSLLPNSYSGALSITPVGPNLWFWFKRFALGIKQKRWTKANGNN